MTDKTQKKCGDCGVRPGELHQHGCDIERCPRCGGQAIGCDCIYEFCGIDTSIMEFQHPDIYRNGPTDEMYEKWDREWDSRRMAWTGEYPGVEACREFGWYAKRAPVGWKSCDADDPEGSEDLNRLYSGEARWDPDAQCWIKPDADYLFLYREE